MSGETVMEASATAGVRDQRVATPRDRIAHRRSVVVLLLVFGLSRAFNLWQITLPANSGMAGDLSLYESWTGRMVDEGLYPYSEWDLEYPPGVVPIVLVPRATEDLFGGYRGSFVALMLLIDGLGLVGLMRLARRRGSQAGPWLWVAGVGLLGPIAYLRLDVVPAVATIWAVERASARSTGAMGSMLGVGILTKIYPALLLPLALRFSARRTRVLWGLTGVLVLGLLPLAGILGDAWEGIFGYHTARGIQIESTWGFLSLVAGRLGLTETFVAFRFGAFEAQSGLAGVFKALALGISVVALVVATAVPRRGPDGESEPTMAAAMFGALALLLAFGTVFSPQFMLWLIALAAAAVCFRSEVASAARLVLPAAALTQMLIPYLGYQLNEGTWPALTVLGLRNGLVLAAGILVLLRLKQGARRPGSAPVSTSMSSVSSEPRHSGALA